MRAGIGSILLIMAAANAAQAAPGGAMQACGAQAARYENGQGFTLSVIRSGEVRIVNPLRPLTPEVTQVLEVAIGGKRATAYGPDFTSLRRGGSPAAMQGSLGGPITWETTLPPLPATLGIVAEDGAPLADLSFKLCETPPVLAPEPQVAKKNGKTQKASGEGGKKAQTKEAQGKKAPAKPEKTPQGFTIPQGAVSE